MASLVNITGAARLTPGSNGLWPGQSQQLTPEQQTAQREAQARFAAATRTNVGQLLDLQARQTELTANANAANLTATGYDKETAAYEAAATTSEADATLAGAAGHIQAYQDLRKYQQTAGSQVATQAGNGFKQSGSALYIAKSSFQQASLAQQMDVVNGTEKQIGYLETAAAARAQGSAAGAAATAARALSTADTAAAGTIGQEASDLGAAMTSYFHTVDPNMVTPEDRLTMSLLSSNPDQALRDTTTQLSQAAATPQNQGSWDAAANPTGAAGPLGNEGLGINRNLAWGLH